MTKHAAFDLATHRRPFATATELAAYLDCDPRTIVRMIHNGSLRGVKVGRCWKVPTEDAREAFHVQHLDVPPVPPESSLCQNPTCEGRSVCRECRNIYARQNRPKHSQLSEEQRMKANARSHANVAQSRGGLQPKPCEVCGSPDAQKHHGDYSKPLDVRWLCRAHHSALHRTHAS